LSWTLEDELQIMGVRSQAQKDFTLFPYVSVAQCRGSGESADSEQCQTQDWVFPDSLCSSGYGHLGMLSSWRCNSIKDQGGPRDPRLHFGPCGFF
jgi:hypothetical protein